MFWVWTGLIVSYMAIVVYTDLRWRIIPDSGNGIFLIVCMGLRWFEHKPSWSSSFVGMGVGFFILFVFAVFSRGGIGGGDIKLVAVLGFIFGPERIMVVIEGAILVALGIAAGGMLIGVLSRKDSIPFAPAIALVVMYVWFNYP
jgi:leader peptidase (prepilin peptidase)/N-methyltransferase